MHASPHTLARAGAPGAGFYEGRIRKVTIQPFRRKHASSDLSKA
ncbi:MAG TPA: hypothetical protein VHC90_06425 [Bryobacteraceae bacterium]|nr:hypothetical protein [Bryobacteraceae bacterium]